jgi:Glycosyltransferase
VRDLPDDSIYMILYPFYTISFLLAWLLRNRKLVVWVKSDSEALYRARPYRTGFDYVRYNLRWVVSPIRNFLFRAISAYLLKPALVFYTGNITFRTHDHRNQHEIISCSNFNRDVSLVKNHFTDTICFVGSESPFKGIQVLLRALQHLKPERPLTLHIIGMSSFTHPTNLRLSTGLEIIFHGRIYDRKQYYDILSQTDILVMPSFGEKQGKVHLEAMSAGVVPVCADSGGTYKSMDNHYNGLLFTPGNHIELAGQIDLLYRESAFYRKLQANALRHLDTLSVERLIGNMASVIHNYFVYR